MSSWRLSQFRAGDVVEVRSEAEILATLDEQGCVDGLPFMPEMLAFCGRKMRVRAVAHKTCETIYKTYVARRMDRAVHLVGANCDGSAHGGCQADCALFWKDVWLKPATPTRSVSEDPTLTRSVSEDPSDSSLTFRVSVSQLVQLTLRPSSTPDQPLYQCQTTQLVAATAPLAWWNVRQYVRDWRTGNWKLRSMAVVLWLALLKWLLRITPVGWRLVKALREKMHRWLLGRSAPDFAGQIPIGQRTQPGNLHLQVGDLVRVKTKEEIEQTITVENKNRGLNFDSEMVPYCGQVLRVRAVVWQILDEETGRMIHFKQPSILLEGSVCSSIYSDCRLLCPRALPNFWREAWMERVEEPSAVSDAASVRGDAAVEEPAAT
jgi:hypothetical protein